MKIGVDQWVTSTAARELIVENGRVVGKFEDAQDAPHPFLLQSLASRVLSTDGSFETQQLVHSLDPETEKRIQESLAEQGF